MCLLENINSRWSLLSVPGEVKDPTQGVNVSPVVDSLILEIGKFENQ